MLLKMRKPSGVIFTYEDRPIRKLKTGWAGALRRATLPHFRFHDLRHTFNSRLGDLGVIADVRKELMGHSRGGDVNSIYTHLELPTLREAIHRLEAWHIEKARSNALERGEAPSTNNQNNQPIETKESPYDETGRSTPAAESPR
jgi:hypothetical protein